MVKIYISLVFLLVIHTSFSQNKDESKEVQKVVNNFFKAFHKQDTLLMKKYVNDKVIMQSISITKDNETVISNSDFSSFLKSIASIPKEMKFEEKILTSDVKIDGNMANVWTKYEFHFNNKLSHKGVNSFQLVKKDGKWLVFYLVDTRHR